MEITKQFTKVNKKQNRNQIIADEIFTYFHKQIPFWRIMKWQKDLGSIFVYESFIETKKSDCKSEIKLFQWKMKNCKIILTPNKPYISTIPNAQANLTLPARKNII